MDIAGLSTALSAISLQSQVSTAVLSNTLDMAETIGQGVVEIMDAAAMERSVCPEIGANLDILI